MSALPERVGKYHVLERLARGGMAEIYKAKSVGIAGFEKILALKRILPDYAREPRFIRSFVDEARIAVSLNHRNIVQVFDFGKAEGELFLAMELIEGVDLRSAIAAAARRDIELPIALSCYILADLGAGLDYAHRKTDARGGPLDIVHCDVSPHNVMISYEGFVKILDFGVARARFSADLKGRRLRGKPRYMAPEQARGEPPTPSTDVFALAILAWELLTGLPLFDGKDVSEILSKVRRSETPDVRRHNPEVPSYLAEAITVALSKDPAARGDASTLAEALARAARELATVASSRALSEWLEELYPEAYRLPESEPTSPTAEIGGPAQGPVDRESDTEESATSPSRSVVFDDEPEEEPTDEAGPSGEDADASADALLEKRRVVASAVLLDGGEVETRRELSRILADLAYKRGAVVHGHTDDSLVAVFGLEVAGEDDVASAMRYALDAAELARETARNADRLHADLTVRIAARAGIVARLREGSLRIRRDAIEEARALAREAEPSRPLLTGGTGRLASAHFAFRELPARRHRRRRLRVLELLGPRDFDDRARALHQRRGRFVGREREIARLSGALDRAIDEGRRVTAALIGEPGVGKSRIVAEFVARARAVADAPALIAIAAGPASREAPFSLVTDFFQAALGLPPGRGESARARLSQRLRRTLAGAGFGRGEIDECVGVVELAMELRDGALISPVQASADLRDRVGGAVRTSRRALLQSRPLLLVIENLHDADGATAEVLRGTLAPPVPEGAELVLLTARPVEGAVLPDHLDEVLRVGELEGDARRALIEDRLAEAVSEPVVGAIDRRAGGNPLFIEELATAVRERGPREIPPSAHDVVVSRADRLPRRTKAVLQHAAVVGPTFRPRILEELVGPQVHAHLEELIDEGLVVTAGGSGEAGSGELAFRHGLIQEVVYESLAAGARKRTHARLGKLLALRSEAGREEPPAVVARHLEAGGQPGAAADFWVRAGRVALAASDAASAQGAFTRALDLDGAEPGDHGERRREALLGREQAYRQLGDHDAEARDLEALQALARGDRRLTAEVESRAAERHLRLGEYEQAVGASERAERAADAAGDARIRGEALRVRGEIYERTGRFDEGLEAVEQAIEIFRRVGATYEETRAMIGIGRNHLMRSRYQAARTAYEPVLERLAGSADPWLERVVQNHLAVIHLCLGEFEEAMKSGRRSLQICEHYGDNARVGDNLSVCGIILGAVGQYREARAWFHRALELLDATRSRWSRADCLVYAGANEGAFGDYDRALEQIESAVQIARDIGARYVEVNAGVALAATLLRRDRDGDADRAAEVAARAVETAREATLVGGEIQALSRQAEAWRRTGARAGALGLSSRAVELLDAQGYLEGSEEEVIYTHYLLLAASGDDRAGAYLERARRGLERKLSLLRDPEWRRSFAGDIPLHAAIRGA